MYSMCNEYTSCVFMYKKKINIINSSSTISYFNSVAMNYLSKWVKGLNVCLVKMQYFKYNDRLSIKISLSFMM